MEKVQIFQDKKVRTHWDAEKEEWYFSVVDVVGVLTDSPDPRNYWKVLKHRLKEEGDETVTNCNRMKMLAQDGKMEIEQRTGQPVVKSLNAADKLALDTNIEDVKQVESSDNSGMGEE